MDYNNEDEDKKINDIVDKLMSYHPDWEKLKRHVEPVGDFAIDYANDWITMCKDDIYNLENTLKNTNYKNMIDRVNGLKDVGNSMYTIGLGIEDGLLNNNFSKLSAVIADAACNTYGKLGFLKDANTCEKLRSIAKKNIDRDISINKINYPEAVQIGDSVGKFLNCATRVLGGSRKLIGK